MFTVQGGRKVPGHSIFNILMLYFFFSNSILYYFRSGVAEKSQDTSKIVQNRIRKKKYSIKILKIECPGTFRPPCSCCLKLLKHDKATSGITHFKLHFQSCSKNKLSAVSVNCTTTASTSKITLCFNCSSKCLLKSAKEKVLNASVDIATHELRSFSAMEGDGLRKLVNYCLKMGAIHGKFNCDDVLPSRWTLQRQTIKKA